MATPDDRHPTGVGALAIARTVTQFSSLQAQPTRVCDWTILFSATGPEAAADG
jgi:hypothetical protein